MTSTTTAQSNRIETLILEGKTWQEIMEDTALNKQQIRYRLKTRFAEGYVKQLTDKITDNEKQRKKEEKKDKKDKNIVIDTSSVKAGNFFTVLNLHDKVYILLGVLEELERLKDKEGIKSKERNNITKLMRESALDRDGEKYVLVMEEQVDSYVDNNILNFCIKHKEEGIVLYTDDAILANKAKMNGIDYELANEQARENKTTVSKKTEKVVVKKEKPVTLTPEQVEEMKQAMQSNTLQEDVIEFSDDHLENLINVDWIGTQLMLTTFDETNNRYYLVEREGSIKEPIGNTIMLKEGDVLYYTAYHTRYNNIQINKYVIVKMQPERYAQPHGYLRAYNVEQVNRLPYPREVVKKLEFYFRMHKK